MKKTRIIGDIHGKINEYTEIIKGAERSIQVGDFGMGFIKELPQFDANHRFIRGNHDSPEVCKNNPNWIPDGTVENDVMFIGGAWSIDWKYRTPGISWWNDEECSMEQFDEFCEKYREIKPRVMITHDAPIGAIVKMFNPASLYQAKTQLFFEHLLDIHSPQIWIFGHWHIDTTCIYKNTAFVCLGELSYTDIDL